MVKLYNRLKSQGKLSKHKVQESVELISGFLTSQSAFFGLAEIIQ